LNPSENNLKTYLKLCYTMPKKPTDYSRCVMYQIKCNDPDVDHVYVGHTTDFTKRKSQHKTGSKSSDRKLYRTIRENGGWDNFKMLQVETFPCNNKREAEAREDQLMTALRANMNQNRAFMTREQICERDKQQQKKYCEANKEHIAERRKQHYEANKERIKQYHEANKERIAERHKQHYEANKEQLAERRKQHYQANKERIAEQKKQYREANKERIKQYHEANKERIAEQNKHYREANKERINARRRALYQAKKEQSSLAAKQLLNEQTC